MIAERIENWAQLFGGPVWTRAFEYLSELSPEVAEGEVKLDGEDIFSRVMSYPTKEREEAVLESHREYIDIQMALIDSERIEWFPRDGLEVKTPYDADKDVIFYHHPGQAPASVDVAPGVFVVLLPDDAHMPQLKTAGDSGHVKKVVVKVRAARIEGTQ